MSKQKRDNPKQGQVPHPLYDEYKRILSHEHEYFRYILTLNEAALFIDDYIGIKPTNLTYKQKIKGYSLPFNTAIKPTDQ